MASENTHLLEERGENGLILPAESNENAQPSSYNKTKLGVAVLLSIIGIGAFIAFNARSEVSGAVTGFANALNTASLNAKRSTDSKSKPSHNSTKDSTHPKLKALSSKVNAPVSKPKLRKQSRNKELKQGEYLMSLADKTESSPFNECSSEFAHNLDYTYVKVGKGCISLFNNDITKFAVSTMVTFCGCEVIGPKKYDFVSLQNAGLISKSGAGMISYIATGEDASITLYNTPDFTGNEFQHSVIGPGIQAPCSALQRDKDKNWDNAVYSIVLQAWNNCNDNEEGFVCSPITTSPPVPSPTHSPFVPPTVSPSHSPIIFPTPAPSSPPTPGPTNHPRARPTMEPLARPTLYPTIAPTKSPMAVPTAHPTNRPNPEPSHSPTKVPINTEPTLMPTVAPSMDPRLVICKGKAAEESKIIIGKTFPNKGCATFFWSSLYSVGSSMVSTICTCEDLGETAVPDFLMADVGLVDANGFPTISSIITGYNTSLTVYAPYFRHEGTPLEIRGVDKYVMGPRETADLTAIRRDSGSGLWNDQIKSISLMAWNKCTQHMFKDSCVDF